MRLRVAAGARDVRGDDMELVEGCEDLLQENRIKILTNWLIYACTR